MLVSSTLPVALTTATLTPVRMPGSSPITTRRPGRRGQQQVAQVVGEDLDGHVFRLLAQAANRSRSRLRQSLTFQVQATHLADQVVGGAAGMAPAQVQGDAAFGGRRGWPAAVLVGQRQARVQDLQRAAAEHRQRAVRGHAADRLVVVEVVAELGHLGGVLVLARHQPGAQQAFGPQPFAQPAHQHGVFGPALGQDVAHAVEHRRRVGEAGLGIDEGRGLGHRVQRRVGEQPVGQRLDAGLARDQRPCCGAWACRAGTGPPAPAWSARPRWRRAAAASACPARRCSSAPRRGAPAARAGRPGALPARAAGCRPGPRWPPCGSAR